MKVPLTSSAADVEVQKSLESSKRLNAKGRRDARGLFAEQSQSFFNVNKRNPSCFSSDISK